MKTLVAVGSRFVITDNGELWASNQSLDYQFWTRYLDVYDEAYLVVRAKRVESVPNEGLTLATGPNIKAIPLPYFEGPSQYLKVRAGIQRAIKEALKGAEAIQLRQPDTIGSDIYRNLKPGRPYGVELVGDPYDVYSPGSVPHPLRPLFRWWFPRLLRRECLGACAVTYVTKHALQARYPASPNAYSTYYSSVVLPDQAFAAHPRSVESFEGRKRIVFVGSLAQLYKAPEVLIDAVNINIQQGLDVELAFVGDGVFRAQLESQVQAHGIGQRVQFLGVLPSGQPVREQLDQADLFVLPSRMEGLPRAMIEAMARGLPCVGSTAGGIPELLEPENLVPPGDVHALAEKIREVLAMPERMARMSARNLEIAQEYREEVLRQRRIEFYQHVKNCTEAWLSTAHSFHMAAGPKSVGTKQDPETLSGNSKAST